MRYPDPSSSRSAKKVIKAAEEILLMKHETEEQDLSTNFDSDRYLIKRDEIERMLVPVELSLDETRSAVDDLIEARFLEYDDIDDPQSGLSLTALGVLRALSIDNYGHQTRHLEVANDPLVKESRRIGEIGGLSTWLVSLGLPFVHEQKWKALWRQHNAAIASGSPDGLVDPDNMMKSVEQQEEATEHLVARLNKVTAKLSPHGLRRAISNTGWAAFASGLTAVYIDYFVVNPSVLYGFISVFTAGISVARTKRAIPAWKAYLEQRRQSSPTPKANERSIDRDGLTKADLGPEMENETPRTEIPPRPIDERNLDQGNEPDLPPPGGPDL